MLSHLALVEHDVLLGIDPTGDKRGGDFADRAGQFGGILPCGDGVQVDDAVDAVVAILQLDEALDGAEVVAKVQIAGRLHAGKHQFLEGHIRMLRAAESGLTRASHATATACPARAARYSARLPQNRT